VVKIQVNNQLKSSASGFIILYYLLDAKLVNKIDKTRKSEIFFRNIACGGYKVWL